MTGDQPAPDVRICFFGDSFTVGVGDPLGVGWVVPVVAAAGAAGHAVTAYNLGIRRDTSLDISRRWALEAAERLKDGTGTASSSPSGSTTSTAGTGSHG